MPQAVHDEAEAAAVDKPFPDQAKSGEDESPGQDRCEPSLPRPREVRLQPSRAATYSFGCRHGERLVRGFSGLLFDQSRPPSARQLREVSATERRVGQGLRVGVRTGRNVGTHDRVKLQITAICRA